VLGGKRTHQKEVNGELKLTTTAPSDSALRLELRPGEWVLWEGRVHRLESLKGLRARIQETGSADLREVLVTELRGIASLPIAQLDRRLDNLRSVDTPDWNKAQQREAIICDAKILGMFARTVRRLITRYTASAQTTSLIAHPSGPKKSYRRLGPELERIIDAAIQTHYLVRPRTPM
jgi:hypothetical protein